MTRSELDTALALAIKVGDRMRSRDSVASDVIAFVPKLVAEVLRLRNLWAATVKSDCILMHGGRIDACPQNRPDCAEARAILIENADAETD